VRIGSNIAAALIQRPAILWMFRVSLDRTQSSHLVTHSRRRGTMSGSTCPAPTECGRGYSGRTSLGCAGSSRTSA
jgi:hypothetical protein